MNVSRFRDRRVCGSAAQIGLIVLLCASACPVTAKAGTENATDIAQLETSVAYLRDRVDELAGRDGLLDSLHFGWFDRPYARATLTVLVKTTSTLEREVRLRRRGNGAIADVSVREMLSWAQDALARVVHSKSDATFRPHRQRVTGADLTDVSATPALFAFVDRATSTRYHGSFGDMDLMASIGFRIYARLERELGSPEAMTVRVDRAHALGIAAVVIQTSPLAGDEASSPHASTYATGEMSDTHALTIEPMTLRGLLGRSLVSTGRARQAVAIADPPFGESWASSIARRALARGVSSSARYVSDGWSSPTIGNAAGNSISSTAAAMWVHAIDGQSLGLFRGWRDLRDGSGSLHSSVVTDPALTETIAYTALDLLRLGEFVSPLRSKPILAVAVSLDAIDAKDANRWAGWTESFWSALIERQIPFAVINAAATSTHRDARYPVVFSLDRPEVEDLSRVLVSLERRMAQEPVHNERVTARELDGRFAGGVFVRDGQTPDRQPCVAVINLSNEPRRLKLEDGAKLGPLRDLISRERIDHPNQSIALAPWQVRLLWRED